MQNQNFRSRPDSDPGFPEEYWHTNDQRGQYNEFPNLTNQSLLPFVTESSSTMPQLVLSSENGSCLADGYLELNSTPTNNHHSKQTKKSHLRDCDSFAFEASNNLEVKEKSSDCFRFGYINEEFKNSPDSYASDGTSGDIFLSKEPWSTCYVSDSRGIASPVSPKHLIDSVIGKYYPEDQREQFLSMKNKDRKMGERKERLKCVGLDPTYRAFMDEELSQSSQDVKKVDYMDKQSAVPHRINPESQMFPNKEVMKVLDSASSRFSNFFSDSQTLVLNEVGEQSGVLPTDKRLDERAVSENSNFVASVVDVNLEQSSYENDQQLLIKANIDPNASLEQFTNDEISNSLEKIFTENTSAESSNVYLKDGQEIEFVLESGDLAFAEKTDDGQSDISKILVIDDSENMQTIEIIIDEGDLPVDSTYSADAGHILSIEPERIDVSLKERGETEAPLEYVISMESDGNSTIPEDTNIPSIQTSECLYTELDSNNEVITYVNVPVSEINSLNQRLEDNSIQNNECQPGYEIQENVLYSQQQTHENPNDVRERDTSENQTLVENKRDIISEAYLEAMTGCIDMTDGGMLAECISEENRLENNEITYEGKSQFMELCNNTVTEPKSGMVANNRPKNLPMSDEEMEFSNEDSLIVPKARKSLPSTPHKSTAQSNQIPGSIGNLLESKLNICGFDSSNEKTEQDRTEQNSSYSISDSDSKPQKSTARKSIRGKLLKSSSPTNSDSSNDASNSLPQKKRKIEELNNLDALSPVKAPPLPKNAMKTFVKPFTVAKKSVTEQTAYKTVFQALGVKTAMKTVKPSNSKTTKDKEGKAIVVSLNDNELSVEEMSPDDSKSTPLCWSPMKELIPQKNVCLCTAEKLPCLLNGETLQLICEAEDSIDGQTIPCKKEVNQQYLLTPSSGIKHKTLCDAHLWRLQKHQCCSKCGLFCTQGVFLLCSSSLRGGKESHFFHPGCLLVPGAGLPPSCPHCCRFSEFKNVKLVLLEKETEDSSQNLDKNTDAKSITNGLENYSVVMQTINVEPKKPLNGSFTAVKKQELQSMVMAITGEKSLHLRPAGKCLLNPIKNGDVKKVLQLIVNGVNPNHKFKTHKNNTPLHIGAYYGFTGIVSILIQFGADIDAVNDDLETPLILAVERNQFAIVRYLVFAGAQVNVKNENGLNAFHVAAKKGSKDIGEFLYNTGKFGVNMQDDGGWTPLVWACEKGFSDYIEWLLELGADPNVRDNEENTALHWAACTGDSDILTMFLDHGCNLTFVNQRGDSALHIAARKDNFSCVKLLLKRDAPVDVKNKEGETPLQCCDMGTKSLRMLKRHVSNVLRMEKVPLLHNVVYRDISRGAEAFPIQAVNEVDTEEFLMDFRYIIRNCYGSGLRIVATVESMEVCHCKDNCGSNNCTCIKLSKCSYDMSGILLSDFGLSDPPSIYECNKTCHCPKTCINRIVQQGLKIPLQVFRTLTMGWGVRTLKELPKGTFVCEYIGEVLDGKEIAQREDDSYLFNLESKTGDVCLDGRFFGNVARFINHSCDPNLVGVRVFIEHQDLNFPRIAFFTLKNVEAYEELSFDYGIHFWIVKSQTTLCTCNASSCKYSKDSIDDTLQNYVDQKLRT